MNRPTRTFVPLKKMPEMLGTGTAVNTMLSIPPLPPVPRPAVAQMLIVAWLMGWRKPMGALLARETPLTVRLNVDAGRFRLKLMVWRLVRTKLVANEYNTVGVLLGPSTDCTCMVPVEVSGKLRVIDVTLEPGEPDCPKATVAPTVESSINCISSVTVFEVTSPICIEKLPTPWPALLHTSG